MHGSANSQSTLIRGATNPPQRRALLVNVIVFGLLGSISYITLACGHPALTFSRWIDIMSGLGKPGETFVLMTVRLPRLITALLVGAALGAAGGIFQSISRNPLGSPDIMGFNAGAATGGLLVMFVLNLVGFPLVAGAMAGGLLTALLTYALSFKSGVNGFRLVLVGIGIGPILGAVNSFILSRANVNKAQEAAFWLAGSLNGAGWEDVVPVAIALAVLLLVLSAIRENLSILEMGDDLAASLGVRVEMVRILAIAVGVLMTAVATSSAGPIHFIALAAPHIARSLVPRQPSRIVTTCLTGALLLSASDLLAQRAVDGVSVPVGVVTGILGGIYLGSWMVLTWRRRIG